MFQMHYVSIFSLSSDWVWCPPAVVQPVSIQLHHLCWLLLNLLDASTDCCRHWFLSVPCMLCCSTLPFSDAPMPLWRPSTLIQDALLAISLKPKFNKVNSNKSPVDTWIWMSNNSTFGGTFFSQRKRMTNELTHHENIAQFMWTMIRQKLIKISGLMSHVNICKL